MRNPVNFPIYPIKKENLRNVIIPEAFYVVPLVGVEPTRYRYHGILSPARLPIPPQRHFKLP